LNVYRALRAPDADDASPAPSCCGEAGEVARDSDFDVNEYAASVTVLANK
jgi:hypothetical protein